MTGERFITQNVHAKVQDCGQFFQKMRDAIPHGSPRGGSGQPPLSPSPCFDDLLFTSVWYRQNKQAFNINQTK